MLSLALPPHDGDPSGTCSGFPPALTALKQHINETVAGLPLEYSGSKWPKASLGALHDKARLTPEQLQQLNTICRSGLCIVRREHLQAMHAAALLTVATL